MSDDLRRTGSDPADAGPEVIPVFVVGCPRSGTTLVGELIAAHGDVFNGKESLFLYLLKNWEAMLQPPLAPLTTQFLAAAKRLMRDLVITETLGSGKSHYLDHTPWHALCLEELWSVFPEAKVVHVVRHPADVVASLGHSYAAGFRWAGATVAARAQIWLDFLDAVRPYTGDERLLTLRYEDLCSRPSHEGRSIYQWIDLRWDDAKLDVFASPHAPNPGRDFALAKGKWPSLTFSPRPPRRIPQATTRALRSVGAATEAVRLGYDMTSP